ncbi:MAG TPA: 1-deoxy-D-xylulose-5-phosphate reductoisomerase [Phycisphaerae bacterium]|nr:1-deoxy-D-xylulose-5-phosphate reductoisomerase [Phycisphaerae bacterium]
MPKRVIILGSTGSIGRSALSVADNLPGEFEIVGLAAGSNWERLCEQAERYRPRVAVLSDESAAERAADRLKRCGADTIVHGGPEALVQLVKETDADFVLAAIVGIAGLSATLAAIERGLTVGLANKEALVVAGQLMVDAAARSGAKLFPVDSEHSAIYQSLHSGRHEEIERLLLTASGGPFRTWTLEKMRTARPAEALKHPTWEMGPKITIDSATMMNKALEVVEARWLFDVSPDRIEVVIHPESIIHSMVAFRDGSIVAQMGSPDMRTPIQYAMTYPRRLTGCSPRLDFSKLDRMTFEPPDEKRFPSLRLGHEVARLGGTAGAAMNAANEAAVDAFRKERIGFPKIVEIVEDVLRRHEFEATPSLATLFRVDAWARNEVLQCCTV